jgi:hypothetical protein
VRTGRRPCARGRGRRGLPVAGRTGCRRTTVAPRAVAPGAGPGTQWPAPGFTKTSSALRATERSRTVPGSMVISRPLHVCRRGCHWRGRPQPCAGWAGTADMTASGCRVRQRRAAVARRSGHGRDTGHGELCACRCHEAFLAWAPAGSLRTRRGCVETNARSTGPAAQKSKAVQPRTVLHAVRPAKRNERSPFPRNRSRSSEGTPNRENRHIDFELVRASLLLSFEPLCRALFRLVLRGLHADRQSRRPCACSCAGTPVCLAQVRQLSGNILALHFLYLRPRSPRATLPCLPARVVPHPCR